MSTNRGIFETFNNQSSDADASGNSQPRSPFAVATDQFNQGGASQGNNSPAPEAKPHSPFAIVEDNDSRDGDSTVRLPQPRKTNQSPFQMAEPQGFGFEAQPQARVSPFGNASQSQAPQQPANPPASPFAMAQPAAAPAQPAQNPFGGWPQATNSPSQQSPAPQHAVMASGGPAPQPSSESGSDSYSIKQLELRAIFGVDREMTKDEILQRARSLPGVRHIAKVSENDISAVDALKQVISNLGFGGGSLKLYAGSVPIDFIREGETLLAVQTDGGFAPGIRETLMIVAREISR